MNISRRWIEAFLRQPIDPVEAAARLGMLGAPVDAIATVGAELAPFVVGLVTEVRPHPSADKLQVTTVDDGSGALFQVVCGAPNVAAGTRYPFARLGTTMPNGMVIERRKLRGEVSEGMLCSARELGLGQDHDGILALDTEAPPGTGLLEVLGLGDHMLTVDVTPNRPDLFGHKGVARELAIAYGLPFRLPAVPNLAELDLPTPTRYADEASVGGIRLAITDRAGCGRFLAATIRGVTVGPSPEWLVERLQAVGVRTINNVVDVTNYVMLELNQPMHAYDAATLVGPAVVVRAARAGEQLTTLDGVTRTLGAGTLVIADAERVIGIAGVMGGGDTEVTERTRDVFLECAWFEPLRVRAARRGVNLSTEASQRFERGTDRWGAVEAFRRAIRLLIGVAGGALDGPTVDCFPAPSYPPRIFLRPSRIAQVLGIELGWTEIERCLVAIGATVVSKPEDGRIAVDVPGWRPDITSEIDLVEEVARIHGYDNIPTELRPFRPGARRDDAAWTLMEQLRTGAAALGLSEVMTLPMVGTAIDLAPRIQNPLSADHGRLREALLPALVRQVEANFHVMTRDVRLFEIGTVFTRAAPGERPIEATNVAFAVTGARHPAHWSRGSEVTDWDPWDARWLFERLLALAHPTATVQVEAERWVAVGTDGRTIGWCGAIEADTPPWAGALLGGEIRTDPSPRPTVRFEPLPSHPAVTRDLALLLGSDRRSTDVLALLTQRGARFALERSAVVDEYRGSGLPDGTRSVAFRLVFRAGDRTLTDKEVDQATARLVQMLERELDVTLRSS
ncbi:MAG TPA: phenylalanine--tRNA ligase subunit beta [Gemmatimonadales bacterium]|nr:phenylalanine--tRNA ligase subunit beta [Gemmatimonadales bacterium]